MLHPGLCIKFESSGSFRLPGGVGDGVDVILGVKLRRPALVYEA